MSPCKAARMSLLLTPPASCAPPDGAAPGLGGVDEGTRTQSMSSSSLSCPDMRSTTTIESSTGGRGLTALGADILSSGPCTATTAELGPAGGEKSRRRGLLVRRAAELAPGGVAGQGARVRLSKPLRTLPAGEEAVPEEVWAAFDDAGVSLPLGFFTSLLVHRSSPPETVNLRLALGGRGPRRSRSHSVELQRSWGVVGWAPLPLLEGGLGSWVTCAAASRCVSRCRRQHHPSGSRW